MSSVKRIVFLGLPGAGKGTQAKLFSEKHGLAHISTGEMLRAAVQSGSELGQRVKQTIDAGKLVSDELIIDIIEDRVQQEDCAQGYILDGFPRTEVQGQALNDFLNKRGEEFLAAVYFELPEEEVISRLTKRAQIEGRADDSRETQLDRIAVYKEQTLPLVAFYKAQGDLVSISALGSVEEVQGELEKAIGDLN
jgi:adenylate kinase